MHSCSTASARIWQRSPKWVQVPVQLSDLSWSSQALLSSRNENSPQELGKCLGIQNLMFHSVTPPLYHSHTSGHTSTHGDSAAEDRICSALQMAFHEFSQALSHGNTLTSKHTAFRIYYNWKNIYIAAKTKQNNKYHPFQSNRPHWWTMLSPSCTAECKWDRLPMEYLIQLSKGC